MESSLKYTNGRSSQGFFSVAEELRLLVGEDRLLHVLILADAGRLASFLKFHFNPGSFVIAFPVKSQAHLLLDGMSGQLGFQLANMRL
jgi:hypothetical protein